MADMNKPVGTAVTRPQGIPVKLPQDMLKSLCFNCDKRSNCIFVEKRKIYCELFE